MVALDTVILAAGNGSRLRGTVARGLKPLVVVEGEALIARLVRQVSEVATGRVIIVTSSLNVGHIADLVEAPNARYVVQPEPLGPGDAMRLGLELSTTRETLVLTGDNVISTDDLKRVAEKGYPVIGVREFAPDDPYLVGLTRLLQSGEWIEKHALMPDQETGVAWAGPLVVDTRAAYEALIYAVRPQGGELLIGPHVGSFGCKESVEVMSRDVGDGSYPL